MTKLHLSAHLLTLIWPPFVFQEVPTMYAVYVKKQNKNNTNKQSGS